MSEDAATFFNKALKALDESIMGELCRDATISGLQPDRRTLEAKIQKKRDELQKWEPNVPAVREASLVLLDEVAKTLRSRIKG